MHDEVMYIGDREAEKARSGVSMYGDVVGGRLTGDCRMCGRIIDGFAGEVELMVLILACAAVPQPHRLMGRY
jgi:hypothetical protein